MTPAEYFCSVSEAMRELGEAIQKVMRQNVRGQIRAIGKMIDSMRKTRRGRQVLRGARFYAKHTLEGRNARRIHR